jgi:DNA (cytosine-5)-methyltransferase 1
MSEPLYHLDCFTGIGGFHLAAERNGMETICAMEIDPYNRKLIDRNLDLDNCGDIRLAVIRREDHPHTQLCWDEDIVPVEEFGETSLCIEDFEEGIVPYPDIGSGGFPCQDVSPANMTGCMVGIDGDKSGLVKEQLRIYEELMPPFAIFENSRNLNSRGLDYILAELNRLGYIVEYETISAVAFGFPHYRHRLYIVAYLPFTQIAQLGIRIFDEVREIAKETKGFNLPLLHEDPEGVKAAGTVENPKSIPLRTKRINGLGNAVIPAIPEAIFKVITKYEKETYHENYSINRWGKHEYGKPITDVPKMLQLENGGWYGLERDLFDTEPAQVTKLPSRGFMANGVLYSDGKPDPVLNVSTSTYTGLYFTLGRKDGNNNGNPSRADRPGGLGGLNGQLCGALNPGWCEVFMGYPINHTKLKGEVHGK